MPLMLVVAHVGRKYRRLLAKLLLQSGAKDTIDQCDESGDTALWARYLPVIQTNSS